MAEIDAKRAADAQKAHNRAEIVGARVPFDASDTPDGIANAFRRFNNSVVRPTAKGLDRANPDFAIRVGEYIDTDHYYAPDTRPTEKLRHEVENPVIRRDPETGQQFNSILANREILSTDPDQAVTVYSGLYLNVINQDDEARARITALAQRMPDRALRVGQVIKPGEGHLAGVHPNDLASIVKFQLDGSTF